MRADEAVTYLSVGDTVWTPAMGEWLGGLCEVIELHPDPEAPEIVMNVRSLEREGDEIGVFGYEDIEVGNKTL